MFANEMPADAIASRAMSARRSACPRCMGSLTSDSDRFATVSNTQTEQAACAVSTLRTIMALVPVRRSSGGRSDRANFAYFRDEVAQQVFDAVLQCRG